MAYVVCHFVCILRVMYRQDFSLGVKILLLQFFLYLLCILDVVIYICDLHIKTHQKVSEACLMLSVGVLYGPSLFGKFES